jgi:Uma2 family endonuclease
MLPVMSNEREQAVRVDPDDIDERVFLHGVTWEDYERLLEIRGDSSRPRMTYLDGELELMSPSNTHEEQKATLDRLIQAWSEAVGIPLDCIASWTLTKKRVKRGAEPDTCYRIGEGRRGELPDFVIEVVHTRGGISKLEVYRKLGVREVWYWEKGRLAFHALRDKRYEAIARSELLPTFDPALIERCMAEPTQHAALRALREALPPRP